MRENDQTQRMKTQNELIPEQKKSSNIPLMSMTPIQSSNSSSAVFKDLTSNLFEQNNPSYTMSTSQTMPSLIRPTIVNTIRPTLNFSSSSNTNDLTSSLLNKINSFASRPQTTPSNYSNSGTIGGNVGLFQPPPPPGSTVVKGTNVMNTKSASAELDDLLN